MTSISMDRLKKIISEELNKELHSNVPVISDVGLGMVKQAFLTMPYVLVEAVEKVNESQSYNFTKEDCLDVVNFVIENITKLVTVNESSDYEGEQIKRKIDSANKAKEYAKRDKLNYDMKKIKDKLGKL